MRIVYIEDGDFRLTFGPALQRGLGQDGVEIIIRETLDDSLLELAQGTIADVYILDHEILPSDITGADFALQIKEEARKIGKEVLVISLLCSNPKAVENEYGLRFEKLGIPVLSKMFHAAICLFFVGACIKENKLLDLNTWLTKEGLKIDDFDAEIQAQLITNIEFEGEVGCCYLRLRQYVNQHREGILNFMRNEIRIKFNRLFPQIQNGIERM